MTEDTSSRKDSWNMFEARRSNSLEQDDSALRIGFKERRIVRSDFKSSSFLVIAEEGSCVADFFCFEDEVKVVIVRLPDSERELNLLIFNDLRRLKKESSNSINS